ncbi:hypothetical protein JMJ77_0002769, partial [Colletotrichum scovillei]
MLRGGSKSTRSLGGFSGRSGAKPIYSCHSRNS